MTFAPDQTTAEGGIYHNQSQNGSSARETLGSGKRSTTSSVPTITEQDDLDFKAEFLDHFCTYRDGRNEKSKLSNSAADLEMYDNFQMVNTFHYLGDRVLKYSSRRCSVLQEKLMRLEKQRGGQPKRLTKNQLRPAGHPNIVVDDYDVLIHAVEEEFLRYNALVAAQQSMAKLYPIYPQTYDARIDKMLKANELDKTLGEDSAWVDWNRPDDMAALRPQDPPWVISWAERLLDSRVYRWLTAWTKHSQPAGPHLRRDDFIPVSVLNFIRRAVYNISAAVALLLPAGILYLADLTKQQEFGFMGGSTILFILLSSIIASPKDDKLGSILFVGIAYTAFLATTTQSSNEADCGHS